MIAGYAPEYWFRGLLFTVMVFTDSPSWLGTLVGGRPELYPPEFC